MSFDMYALDEAYYQNLGAATTTNMVSPEFSNNFFTDPLSDSSIDSLLQEISSDNNSNNQVQNQSNFDQITQTLLSNSPPSQLLETLSLSQTPQTHSQYPSTLPNTSNMGSAFSDYNVKTEDFHMGGFDCFLLGGSTDNHDSLVMKFMQRSYSSHSFDGKPGFLFQPSFDFDPNLLEDSSACGQMRRVCSTGDLPLNTTQQHHHEVGMNQTASQGQQSMYGGEANVGLEEANFKVGRYSAEERKERIDRYRAKRTQRNFNKTIKYACRKTLADNRPRIRGRFARNDETGEIPKPSTCIHRYEDDDDLWVDNLQEEDNEEGILTGRGGGGRFLSNFGGIHFQYCGY